MIRKLFSTFAGRFVALSLVILIVAGVAAAMALTVQRVDDRLPKFHTALKDFKPLEPPQPAPAISFTDAQGHSLSLADFRGRVVLLNFWATWCVPCVEEMPSLDNLQAKLGNDDFIVVAISTDRQGLSIVQPFLDKLGIRNLAIYLDPPHAAQRAFGIRGIPTTIVIDREGRERGRLEGMTRWDSSEALTLIRHYLGPAVPPTTRADAGR
jgi:thiol-disulfide isomerase/thioredoxin